MTTDGRIISDMMKRAALSLVAVSMLAGCDNDANVASRNLSQAANNSEINPVSYTHLTLPTICPV